MKKFLIGLAAVAVLLFAATAGAVAEKVLRIGVGDVVFINGSNISCSVANPYKQMVCFKHNRAETRCRHLRRDRRERLRRHRPFDSKGKPKFIVKKQNRRRERTPGLPSPPILIDVRTFLFAPALRPRCWPRPGRLEERCARSVPRTEVAAAGSAPARSSWWAASFDSGRTRPGGRILAREEPLAEAGRSSGAVDHAMAASYRGRPYVLGGYGPDRRAPAGAFVFRGGAWRNCRRCRSGAHRGQPLSRGEALRGRRHRSRRRSHRGSPLDLRTSRGGSCRARTPREHLAGTFGAARSMRSPAAPPRPATSPPSRCTRRPGALDEASARPGHPRRHRRGRVGNRSSRSAARRRQAIETVYAYNVKARRWSRLPTSRRRGTAWALSPTAGACTPSPAAPSGPVRQHGERVPAVR